MNLVNSNFHTRNNFSENYPQFGHAPLKISPSPVLGWEYLKNIGFNGGQIITIKGKKMVRPAQLPKGSCAGRSIFFPLIVDS